MDTAINNGDFLLGYDGLPMSISGVQEILQRALIRLTVKKGSFIFDTNLGSNLYKLKAGSRNIKNEALSIVKEALEPMQNVSVDDLAVESVNFGENLKMNIILSVNNKREEVEVMIWVVHMMKY